MTGLWRTFPAAALALAACWPGAAGAGPPPSLSFPLECMLGRDCFIQQYVDGDPGPGVRDYACGRRSYDGHKGTDIRLAHIRTIAGGGVAALAAAPGRVLATRNTMDDIAQNDPAAPDVGGQECGNGVLVEHGGGWRSQYCHLRKDSVLVAPGQTVARGQPLGLVGLSGLTEFPHLHIKITKDGGLVDPFRPENDQGCGDDQQQLWSSPIAYAPGGIMSLGFADSALDYDMVRQGPAMPDRLGPDAPALTVWGFFYGVAAGDEIRLSIRSPDGGVLAEHSETTSRDQAEAYRFIGKRRGAIAWPRGIYTGSVELLRNGESLDRKSVTIRID